MLLTFEWRKQKTDSVVINIHPSLVYSPHLSHFSWAERESWAVCVYTGLAFSATFIQIYKLFCVLSPWLSNCIILGIAQLDKKPDSTIEINILWLKSDHFDQNTKIKVIFWDTAVSMGLWNTCIGFIGKVSRPLIVDHPTSFKDRFNWWRVFRLQRVVIGMMATKQLNWMENLQSLFCISTFLLNWFR